jgi:hypothetical protein
MSIRVKFLCPALLALAMLPAKADHVQLKPGFNLFSKEQDVQLGREAAAQVQQQMPIVRDQGIVSFVEQIGRKLASQPKAGGFPYSFQVVNDPGVNAFALPGGPTFVNTGLLKAAENEAQVAGVMAHEIAHVALRHGTNQASKANLIQLPVMIAGGIAGGSGSLLGQLAQLGVGLGANSVLLKFSRGAEREADLLGAQLMAGAGYDPMELARFFEKLESQGGARGPEFLSSHPNPGNRRGAIAEEVRTLPRRNYTSGTGRFGDVQRLVAGLPAAPRGGRGAVSSADRTAGGARSEGGFREYRGRAFSISYPSNWDAYGDPDSGMLTVAPRQGIVQARDGSSAIGYGATLSFFVPHHGDGRVDLERETRDLIGQLQSSNPSMQVNGQARRIRVGGQNGLSIPLYSSSPLGGEEVDLLVTTARPEGLFYCVLIAPRSEFDTSRALFDQMIRSIRFSQ